MPPLIRRYVKTSFVFLLTGLVLGGLGQVAGAGLFVRNMWWRVRMPVVAPPTR